jgi:hypothetical protein
MVKKIRLYFISLFVLVFVLSLYSCGDGESSDPNIESSSIPIWHHPLSVSDHINPYGAADSPVVAMDDNGNAIVVWQQYDGQTIQIYMSEFRNGTWENPTNLLDHISVSGEDAFRPKVAMDNNGNAIIAWIQQPDGVNAQLYKSEYRNGSWTHPLDLDDNFSPDGQAVQTFHVAMDNNGSAIIVWDQYTVAAQHIYKSEYRNGIWEHPSSLLDRISPDGGNAGFPHMAMADNNEAVIVWSQFDGSDDRTYISEYRNDMWTHPSGKNDAISPEGEWATNQKVAMDNNGNTVVVWEQSDGSYDQIFKSEYRDGIWTHPSGLNDNISPDGQSVGNPKISMDKSGNIGIVWHQSDGIEQQIFLSEYRKGNWNHPQSLIDNISPDSGRAVYPQISLSSNNQAIAVWYQFDGFDYQIYKSEYRNGVWNHPTTLADNISPDNNYAAIPFSAIDSQGRTIIVWRQNDGDSAMNIMMSEYR